MKLFSFFSKRAQVSKRFTVKIRNYLLNSYYKDTKLSGPCQVLEFIPIEINIFHF